MNKSKKAPFECFFIKNWSLPKIAYTNISLSPENAKKYLMGLSGDVRKTVYDMHVKKIKINKINLIADIDVILILDYVVRQSEKDITYRLEGENVKYKITKTFSYYGTKVELNSLVKHINNGMKLQLVGSTIIPPSKPPVLLVDSQSLTIPGASVIS